MGPRQGAAFAAAHTYWSRRRAVLHAPLVPIALKEALVLQEITANGPGSYTPPAPAALPAGKRLSSYVKTMVVVLEGDYDGVQVKFWANPPLSLFETVSARGAEARIHDTLLPVILEWNLLAEDGTPLPRTAESISQLPMTLAKELQERFYGLISIPKTTSDS